MFDLGINTGVAPFYEANYVITFNRIGLFNHSGVKRGGCICSGIFGFSLQSQGIMNLSASFIDLGMTYTTVKIKIDNTNSLFA